MPSFETLLTLAGSFGFRWWLVLAAGALMLLTAALRHLIAFLAWPRTKAAA